MKNSINVKMAFGWRSNANADGFEQNHGRYTVEVYWKEDEGSWGVHVWQNMMNEDNKIVPTIIREAASNTLAGAKYMAISMAANLAKQEALAR